MAQEVEHILGKDEVTSSNLVISSTRVGIISYSFVLTILLYSLRSWRSLTPFARLRSPGKLATALSRGVVLIL